MLKIKFMYKVTLIIKNKDNGIEILEQNSACIDEADRYFRKLNIIAKGFCIEKKEMCVTDNCLLVIYDKVIIISGYEEDIVKIDIGILINYIK